MSREFFIAGANADDVYCDLACSEQLYQFISAQGATNPEAVKSMITRMSGSFAKLPGYEEQSERDYPVSLRYLPMHLYKRDDMPKSMQPIYVVSVSGAENTKRNSTYSCIALMDIDELCQPGDKSYMTQIFGTHLMSWQEMREIRERRAEGYWGVEKTEMNLSNFDRELALAVIDAIYQDKTILIRLERNAPFNLRALQLLKHIYSLMEPRLATETGFATYQDPTEVSEMMQTAGLRLFILPAEARLDSLPDKTVLMDIGSREGISVDNNSEVVKCLRKWGKLSPKDRLAVYKGIFGSGYDFSTPEYYISTSNEFFEDYNSMIQAVRNAGANSSFDELYHIYCAYPLLTETGDWYSNQFYSLLKKNKGLRKSSLEIASVEITKTVAGIEGSIAPSSPDMGRFAFAKLIIGSDAMGALAKRVGERSTEKQYELIDKPKLIEKDKQLASYAEEKKKALSALKAEYENILDSTKAEHEAKLFECEDKLVKQKASYEGELTRLTAECKDKISAQAAIYEDELVRQKTSYEGELTRLTTECENKISAQAAVYEDKLVKQRTSHKDELTRVTTECNDRLSACENEVKRLKRGYENEIANQKAAHENEINRLKTAQKDKIDELTVKLKKLNFDKQAAEGNAASAAKALRDAETGVRAMQSELDKANREIEFYKSSSNGGAFDDLKRQNAKLEDEVSRIKNRADRERDDAKRRVTKASILSGIIGIVISILACACLFFFVFSPKLEAQKKEEMNLLEQRLQNEADSRLASELEEAEENARLRIAEAVEQAKAEMQDDGMTSLKAANEEPDEEKVSEEVGTVVEERPSERDENSVN